MHHSGVKQPGHQVGVTWAAVSWEDLALRWGDRDIYHQRHYWILHAKQRWAVGASDTVLKKKAGWKKQSDELKSVYQYSEWHNTLSQVLKCLNCRKEETCADKCADSLTGQMLDFSLWPMHFRKKTYEMFFHLYSTKSFSGFQTKPNPCLKINLTAPMADKLIVTEFKQTYTDLYIWMHEYFVNPVVYIVFNKLQQIVLNIINRCYFFSGGMCCFSLCGCLFNLWNTKPS